MDDPPSAEVWAFYPSDRSLGALDALDVLSSSAARRGWRLRAFETEECPGPAATVTRLVRPVDAHALYRALHRLCVAVFQIGDAQVKLDPRRDTRRGELLSLESFVSHKAWFHRTSSAGLARTCEGCMDRFDSWRATVGCEGIADPRCLPLHVFWPEGQRAGLSTAAGRSAFQDRHWQDGGYWSHDKRLHWRRGAYHGGEAVHVSGHRLPSGFHWDAKRQHRGQHEVCNSVEVWEVSATGHLNIFPDAYLRYGSGRTRKVAQVRVETQERGRRRKKKKARRT